MLGFYEEPVTSNLIYTTVSWIIYYFLGSVAALGLAAFSLASLSFSDFFFANSISVFGFSAGVLGVVFASAGVKNETDKNSVNKYFIIIPLKYLSPVTKTST